MNNGKSLVCYLFFTILCLSLALWASSVSIETLIGVAAGFALCAEVADGIVSKKEFNFGWISVARENNSLERSLYAVFGVGFLVISVIALFGNWGF